MSTKIVNCPHCGKILSEDALTGKVRKIVKCPLGGSQKNWKDGTRNTPLGKTQRYICWECGYKFSEK